MMRHCPRPSPRRKCRQACTRVPGPPVESAPDTLFSQSEVAQVRATCILSWLARYIVIFPLNASELLELSVKRHTNYGEIICNCRDNYGCVLLTLVSILRCESKIT